MTSRGEEEHYVETKYSAGFSTKLYAVLPYPSFDIYFILQNLTLDLYAKTMI